MWSPDDSQLSGCGPLVCRNPLPVENFQMNFFFLPHRFSHRAYIKIIHIFPPQLKTIFYSEAQSYCISDFFLRGPIPFFPLFFWPRPLWPKREHCLIIPEEDSIHTKTRLECPGPRVFETPIHVVVSQIMGRCRSCFFLKTLISPQLAYLLEGKLSALRPPLIHCCRLPVLLFFAFHSIAALIVCVFPLPCSSSWGITLVAGRAFFGLASGAPGRRIPVSPTPPRFFPFLPQWIDRFRRLTQAIENFVIFEGFQQIKPAFFTFKRGLLSAVVRVLCLRTPIFGQAPPPLSLFLCHRLAAPLGGPCAL